MGITAKYDEIRDDTVLRGVVTDEPHLVSSDGDWCFHVKPAPGWEGLLRNPSGYINKNGYVECEVEPPDRLPDSRWGSEIPEGRDAEASDEIVKEFVGHLKGKSVRVVGTWTRDRQHNGGFVFFDVLQGNQGKTEIHPITSLLGKLPPPNPKTRRFVFMVFSDDSGGAPPSAASQPGFSTIIPPHAGENRHGNFQLPVPTGSNLTKVQEHASKAGSDLIVTTSERASFSYLTGAATSGKPSEGKGFYHLVFDVPALFSLRAYFDSEAYRATARLMAMPPECQTIADKLHTQQEQYNEKVSQKDDNAPYVKPFDIPGAEDLFDDTQTTTQELQACLKKRMSLRSALPLAPNPCGEILDELQKFKQGKKFDKDLKDWVDFPVSQEAIDAKQQDLDECLQNNPPGTTVPLKSLKSLIESSYP